MDDTLRELIWDEIDRRFTKELHPALHIAQRADFWWWGAEFKQEAPLLLMLQPNHGNNVANLSLQRDFKPVWTRILRKSTDWKKELDELEQRIHKELETIEHTSADPTV